MASGRMWLQIGMSGWLTGDYSLRCQPVDYSNRPDVLRVGDVLTILSFVCKQSSCNFSESILIEIFFVFSRLRATDSRSDIVISIEKSTLKIYAIKQRTRFDFCISAHTYTQNIYALLTKLERCLT